MKFKINYKKNINDDIFQKLNEFGIYSIENAISQKDLIKLQNIVKNLLNKYGHRYFTLINPLNKEFHFIKEDKEFFSLSHNIAEKKLKRKIKKNDRLSVLRVITGNKISERSLKFHFDAYILTILLPINIPNSGKNDGHLILFPNLRRKTRYSLLNFVEKIFYQNVITRTIIKFFVRFNIDKYQIELKPGNLYFFWGYQSLHANMPITETLLRSTLLLHFGTVHNESFLDNSIKKIRHSREMINTKKNLNSLKSDN